MEKVSCLKTTGKTPKVVVTLFVYDGGGWNVLRHWPDAAPPEAADGGGANYRNALSDLSFPAVTACAQRELTAPARSPARMASPGTTSAPKRTARGRRIEPGNADLFDDPRAHAGRPQSATRPATTRPGSARSATRSGTWTIGYGWQWAGPRARSRWPSASTGTRGSASWRPHNPELFRDAPGDRAGQDVRGAPGRVHGARLGQGVQPPGRQANRRSWPVVQNSTI